MTTEHDSLVYKFEVADEILVYRARPAKRYMVCPAGGYYIKLEEVIVTVPAILITINRRYRSDMTAEELYEATRGIWVVGPRREKAAYAMSVYQGVVREVYRIEQWHPAGTLEYKTLDAGGNRAHRPRRREFEGHIAEESVRSEYVGFSIGKGGQNPIRYANI
jgi:hypothetical protein